jgi:hypothetical protein
MGSSGFGKELRPLPLSHLANGLNMISKKELVEYYTEERFLSFFRDVYTWSAADVLRWAESLAESRDLSGVGDAGDLGHNEFYAFLITRALVPPAAYKNISLDLAALCDELTSAVALYCREYDNGIEDVYLRIVIIQIDTALSRHGLEFQKLTPSEVVYL